MGEGDTLAGITQGASARPHLSTAVTETGSQESHPGTLQSPTFVIVAIINLSYGVKLAGYSS